MTVLTYPDIERWPCTRAILRWHDYGDSAPPLGVELRALWAERAGEMLSNPLPELAGGRDHFALGVAPRREWRDPAVVV